MTRLDVMTDIETLGTNSDSTIIQISAMAFDIKDGNTYFSFNQIADIEKNEKELKVTGGTIKWWLKTDKELFAQLINSGESSSEDVLRNFHEWLCDLVDGGADLYLWGNGILFDNKMIQHQFERLGLTYPINYRNDRDVRTIVELAADKLGVSEGELKEHYDDESLVHHNAFDDVRYQIRILIGCYKILMGEVTDG
ncbi:3'-5' exonuclease [Neobacillus notoginsengisoli]|uniref:3'-5' exonuclease n=1 Tax=Neobacillus notoginsengisoli TaxID=1578198 RepID=UPI001EFFFA07|nr:3'-5' exonuclease [Neobacillus notoginsengisoli]